MTEKSLDERRPLDLPAFRQRLAEKKNKVYWRSLDELANREDFEELVRQEFPRQASLLGVLNRRDFLKVLGASLALGGLAACAPRENEKIVPYVKPPEELVPANPVYYASASVRDGYARGVLIETTMGRPIKIEGLPGHPDSQGATDMFMQASLLDMYDPDRLKQVLHQGAQATWQDFLSGVGSGFGQGEGLRILTGPVSSPSLSAQIVDFLGKLPQAKWYQFNPLGRENVQAGAQQAFGKPLDAVYNFRAADVILSLDSDFMVSEPGSLRYSRDFSARRQVISTNGTMSRFYMVEASATLTGSNADHRLAVKPSQVEAFARALAGKLGINTAAPAGAVPGQDWLEPLAADLKKAGAAALVIAGARQPAVVHALAHAINQTLGAIGKTVTLVPPVVTPAAANSALSDLVAELNSGAVSTLVILEGNPVYSAPADLGFADALKKAKVSISLSTHADETATQVTWAIPAAHALEMWGDARAYDGTVSLVQPVILPLYGGKSPSELLAALQGQGDARGLDLLKGYWQAQLKGDGFERLWTDALSKGMLPVPAPALEGDVPQVAASALNAASAAVSSGMEIVFEADPTIWDGRYANNSWLQELPKPLTKLTWDNAALISPQTAAKLGLATGDMVDLKLRSRSVQAPVYVQPGQPDDVVVVSLGYGRKAGGTVLEGTGFNAYALRTAAAPWFDSGLEVTKLGKTYQLAYTQDHWNMENRELVRSATLEEYQANPGFAQTGEKEHATLYDSVPPAGQYAWGMSINLSACIGCNACVVACQAENNIPTVGKDQVTRSREMHWLRIDRYYEGPVENPRVFYEPVPCMHCETAPCEPVCPAEATSHSAEGINEMTYNRCVGTRYCSNNCPYKVRRFNFYKYVDENIASLRLMRNPDVTVRSRGVMEKCNYCVQRVNHARIQAEVEGRPIRDGEAMTACQQACPTQAIVFGDINNGENQVSKLKALPLNYSLLEELGTRPRTTYLARVTNPNPLIKEQA